MKYRIFLSITAVLALTAFQTQNALGQAVSSTPLTVAAAEQPAWPPIDGGFSSPEASTDTNAPFSVELASTTPSTANAEADAESARISAIEKKLNDFISGSKATVYPNVKINGVFQADFGWNRQDQNSINHYGNIKDGVDFRRARLAASGALTDVNNYFFQMDFAFFGKPTFTDVWVEQTDLPILGNVRVGQWKQPFSLEVVSSFRYTTFAERSVLFQPFTPFRHLGAGFYNRNDSLTATWAGSVFAAGQDQYGGSISTAGGVGTAERFTYLPQYDEESDGRYYLHLGAGHYFSAPSDHAVNFRTVPEIYIGAYNQAGSAANQQPVPTNITGMPFFVATGTLPVYYYNVLGNELLWVRGPWSLQTESMVNFVNQTGPNPNLTFWGGYAQIGYFLTGEHRPYDRKAGAIDRIKPFENFFRVRGDRGFTCSGSGAWEVATRISHLTLNDGPVRGGTITDLTAGLNWYLNPYVKWQFNYIRAYSTNPAGVGANTDLFDLRLQMDF